MLAHAVFEEFTAGAASDEGGNQHDRIQEEVHETRVTMSSSKHVVAGDAVFFSDLVQFAPNGLGNQPRAHMANLERPARDRGRLTAHDEAHSCRSRSASAPR